MLTFSFNGKEFSEVLSNTDLRKGNPSVVVEQFIQSWFGVAILVTFIPSITVAVRRFHDLGMTGWWYAGLQIVPSLLPNIFICIYGYIYMYCYIALYILDYYNKT